MRPIRVEVLTEGEKQSIHESSLEILRSVGLRVLDNDLRTRLHKVGAIVDDISCQVRLPSELLQELLHEVPKEHILHNRSGKVLPVPTEQTYIGSRLLLPKIKDFGADLLRKPTIDDVIKTCQIANHFNEIDVVFMAESPIEDLPPLFEIYNLLSIQTVLLHTCKHILCLPTNLEAMKSWSLLSQAATESGDLALDHVLTVGISTTSPLQLDQQSAMVLIWAAERGIPFLPAPMIAGGGTGPITNAGELVLMNVESLFLIAAVQAINPGCPAFYGGIPGTLDLRTSILSAASPELPPMTIASLEMGRFYGLPLFSATKYTDSFTLDEQCGTEKALASFAALVGGTDVIYGCGDLGTATVLSMEQIIIDLDIILAARRFYQGIIVDTDRLAVDVIRRVGSGGNYLIDTHTRKYLRSGEQVSPRSYNRLGNRSEARPQLEKAHELVNSITKSIQEPVVSEAAADRIRLSVAERMKEIRANL